MPLYGVGVCILEFFGGVLKLKLKLTHKSPAGDVACRACLSEGLLSRHILGLLIL